MSAAPETRKPASGKETGSQENGKAGSTSTSDINQNTVNLQARCSPATKWKLAHPKAVWAQAALRSALKRGLISQEPCAECGALDADGHHDDYDKPMQVRWLCRLHHRREHLRLKCEAAE